MCEHPRRRLPVALGRGGGVDPQVEQARRPEVGVVAHHPDAAVEGGVPQIPDARDRPRDRLGVVCDPGEAGLPRDREPVAGVVVGVLRERGGVGGEVRDQRVVERDEPAVCDQLGHLPAVRHHDQVVAERPAGREARRDLLEERRVALDHLLVGDLDAGVARERVQARPVLEPVHVVDVERPVGERELPRRALPAPPGGAADGRRARRLAARRQERGGRERTRRRSGAREQPPAREAPRAHAGDEGVVGHG